MPVNLTFMRLVFLIFSFFIVFEGIAKTHSQDSLFNFIKNHPQDDTLKINALNAISDQYQWTDFYLSLHYAEEALKLAQQLHFDKGIAMANYRKGHCYWALGESRLAIELGLEAARIAEQVKSNLILAESCQILARAYMDQKETEIAVSYINKAEKIALQLQNWNLIVRVYNLSGVIQFIDNNTDSALLLYNKALAIAQKHHTPRIHLARIISNIGECYLKTNPELGFDYLYRALLIARETENRAAEAGISSIIGSALIKKENTAESEKFLLASLKLAQQLGLKRVIRHAYSGLAELKVKEGKSSEALVYLKNYYEVRDHLLNVAKTRQIVELEARHELEKKEQAIKMLEQEKLIQRMWQNILIASLVLLTAISVGVYYLKAYRENKNREILNLEIDYLTNQHKEISDKYKNSVINGTDRPIEKTIESHDQRLLKKAIEVVENNMMDSLFGVEKMAQEMGMSRTNMHRKIKAISGFPPSELIRSIRLRRAAVLLLNQADSVSQISLMVGFDDHSYFSKSFKKHFGVAPSEYLASVKQNDLRDGKNLSVTQDGELIAS